MIAFEKNVMRTLLVCALLVFLSEHFLFTENMNVFESKEVKDLNPTDYCQERPEDLASGLVVVMERHNTDPTHGDVCRLSSGEFYCPLNCHLLETSPYCGGSGYSPCRFAPSQCASPSGKDTWAKGKQVALERHSAEANHGDVCRLSTGEVFCPRSCVAKEGPPFCVAIDGTVCRAGPDHPSEADVASLPPPPPQGVQVVSRPAVSTSEKSAAEPITRKVNRKAKASPVPSVMAGIEGTAHCANPTGADAWAQGQKAILEQHEGTMGDICRVLTGGNFCPSGCTSSPEPTFCAGPDGQACRVVLGEEEISSAHPCTAGKVPEWAVGQEIRLERHTMDPGHGDVCRALSSWYCPKDCRIMAGAPYCAVMGSRSSCRAAGAPTAAEKRDERMRMRAGLKAAKEGNSRASGGDRKGGGGAAAAPVVAAPIKMPVHVETEVVGFSATTSAYAATSSLQVECSNYAPAVPGIKPDLHFDTAVSDYYGTYKKLYNSVSKDKAQEGDVVSDRLKITSGGAIASGGKLVITNKGNIVSSAAWNATASIPADIAGPRIGGALVWTEPETTEDQVCQQHITVNGELIVIANWWIGNFHHFSHDALPLVYWIKRFRASSDARFGLPDHPLHRQLINWLDPTFLERIDWIRPDSVVCLEGTSADSVLVAPRYLAVIDRGKAPRSNCGISDLRNSALFRFFALEIAALKPVDPSRPKHVLFYQRASRTTKDRIMPKNHENSVIASIRDALSRNGRKEKLKVFNGENPDGTKLSFQDYFELFRDASAVIGPHGNPLAHLIWLAPSSIACSDAPSVIEFICTQETKLRACTRLSYWSLLGGAPWLKYYHIFLARNSTNQQIFVEKPELDATLDKVFVKPHIAVKFPSTVDATQVLGNARDPLPMLIDAHSQATRDMLPYFFHVPKAAGTTIERILATKRQMKTLPSGDLEDLTFIERSKAVQRNIIEYVKTPLFFAACSFFGRAKLTVKAFTILREPVGRVVSLFWYKKDSTWEKHFDPSAKLQSLESFLETSETDWVTFSFASATVPRNAHGAFTATYEELYAAARFVLLEKMVYGFMDDMENSCKLIFDSFGWEYEAGDVAKLSRNVNTGAIKKNSASSDSTVNDFLPRIAAQNARDVRLYKEARQIYDSKQ